MDIVDTFEGNITVWFLSSWKGHLAAKVDFLQKGKGVVIFFYHREFGSWRCTHSTTREWSGQGGMEFTSDGANLAVAVPVKHEITVIRRLDGTVVRRLVMTLMRPFFIKEFEDGWLVAQAVGWHLVFVNDTREVLVCRYDHGVNCQNGNVLLLPGVGPAVATTHGLLCVLNSWDVEVAFMSPMRVAWMVAVVRAGTRAGTRSRTRR